MWTNVAEYHCISFIDQSFQRQISGGKGNVKKIVKELKKKNKMK